MTNPIEALISNDPNGFRDGVYDMLMHKLGDRLEAERAVVAASMFGNVKEPEVQSSEDDANV